MNITAVIISFNPQLDLLFDNIQSYRKHVNQVIIVDNSTELIIKDKIKKLCEVNQFLYKQMGGNMGIAAALNVGFDYACQYQADWVLTMDQDSSFTSDLDGFKLFIESHDSSNIISLVPVYDFHNEGKISSNPNPVIAPQSGNLVKMANYLKIGPYREDYFIDFVDFEYCLRANSAGLVLCEVNSVVLNHEAGVPKNIRFLGILYNYFEAAPIRYYYVVRNGLNTAKLYYDFKSLVIVLKTIIRIIFIEKQKIIKVKFVFRGIFDFFRGKFYAFHS